MATAKLATVVKKPEGEIVTFLRKRDYRFIRELGQGACGKTVLLFDEDIQDHVVCKKYEPYDEVERAALYQLFVREIKLLYQLHHPNIVRYFHHYLYPSLTAGYILMEFIEGEDIADHIRKAPERINDLFMQAIDGFAYLEQKGIVHRDIRAANILVTKAGCLKIIDLGFGKQAKSIDDFQKSITLNWNCEKPAEFRDGRYDFTTEVYFVGKLFDRLIRDHDAESFCYNDMLRGMCAFHEYERTQTFGEIQQRLRTQRFGHSSFSAADLEVYRRFASAITRHLTKVAQDAKYVIDFERVITQLADVDHCCILERSVPDAAKIIRCFLNGGYYYRKAGFPTEIVRDFCGLLQRATHDQRNTIMANLHTRLDAIPRYDATPDDSDVPF